MKQTLTLLLLTTLAACRHGPDPSADDGLVGTWRLTNLQCYCPAGWLPDEQLLFDDAQRFQLYRAGRLVAAGRYAVGQGSPCAGAASQPLLRLVPDSTGAYAPAGTYTQQGNKLVIDQGSACLADALVATYQRL